jgi:hypothetical protein
MSQTTREQIIEQVDRLDDHRRQQVLEFARRLVTPHGTPGKSLTPFIGSIDQADLDAMAKAIHEGCERIDPNAW